MDAISYAVVGVCIVIMAVTVLSTAIRMIVYDREKRLEYVRETRGKFIVIYIVALPLYVIGSLYDGMGVWEAIVTSVSCMVELVILKFDPAPVLALVEANIFYSFALNFCFAMITANAILFATSVFAQRVSNALGKIKVCRFSKSALVVVGFSKENQQILDSAKGEPTLLVCDKCDEEVLDYAYVNRHACVALDDDLGEQIFSLFGATKKKKVRVVINTGDDEKNLVLVKSLVSALEKQETDDDEINRDRGVSVWAFGEQTNKEVFIHFVKKSKGRVHFVNKHTLIAMDFTSRYPITKFMDERHIDYDSATVRSEVNPTVVMLGFGETSRALLLTMIANNQLMTKKDDSLLAKRVTYRVYDKNASDNDKNLNHTFFRYIREFGEKNKKGYLPIPPVPAVLSFENKDINDKEFYKLLKADLSGKKTEIPYCYVVIDYGNDMENLDVAEKLSEKLIEWGKTETKIFTRIANGELSDAVAEEYGKSSGFVCYGDEREVVFNVNDIMAENNERMAKDRHLCYALEDSEKGGVEQKPSDAKLLKEWKKRKAEKEKEVIAKATEKWYERWEQVQRDSNAYGVMSLRLKLNLLGFDYEPRKKEEKGEDALAEQFSAIYEKDDRIKYEGEPIEVLGNKRAVDYGDCNFKTGTARYNLAVLEHQRWNSYEIINGYVPASIEEMRAFDKQTMIKTRKHANITTFEGLYEYRKMMFDEALKKKKEGETLNEADFDVIKYDYQLLDDALWLLKRNGFKLIKK